MGDEGGDSTPYGDPYGALGKDWFDIANRAPTLLTPEDWYQWGKGQPGFFGTYQDPQTGATRPTPPPARLLGEGYGQAYNPQTGQWEVTATPNGGFFGFVERDPYVFAALAAAAFAGGVVLAAPAAAAGGVTAAEAGGTAAGVSVADAGLAPVALGEAGLTAPTVGGGGGFLSSLGTYAPYLTAGGGVLSAAGKATGSSELQQAGQGVSTAGSVAGAGNTFGGGGGTDTLYGSSGGDTLTPYGEVGPDGYITTDPQVLADLQQAQGDIPASETGSSGFWGKGGTLSDLARYAPLVSAGVGAIGSVVGGVNSASAARDAANTQAGAAREANALLSRIYDQSRADLAPYRAVGTAALGQLATLTDHPLTYGAFDERPYAFTPPTGQQVLNDDPGYAFRVSEGQKALERSGASRGLTLSGGQLKDLTRFGQGQAAQEYQAAYGRSRERNQMAYERGLGAYNTNFGTLTTLRNTRYNELAGLSGTGQTATNAANTLAANTGTQLAANTTSAGAATAAGQVGAANATNSIFTGISGAANSALQYQLLSSLVNRKAA